MEREVTSECLEMSKLARYNTHIIRIDARIKEEEHQRRYQSDIKTLEHLTMKGNDNLG